ncbi:hypothetical protein B0920_22825 [Massilia sp. KIM]|uniref:hypothetical protein n=1 Tax=Massilia sp. KIM TaxID=1955422 RepID=UPI0009901535|nr:hypothetical protein [Massilia sp. KIM]OON59236.1 hypothetical protein B0920_22825 [Massilia sp. KIM]
MLSDFLHTYPVLVWMIIYTAAAAILVSLMWDKLKWWWLNTWYAFPVIGKLKRLSQDLHQTTDGSGWFKSERTLCQDYKAFVQVQSEYDFNERMTYLQKAGDNGRTTTPLAIWILIIAFVFIEAQGFSYVLAGYTVPGASETTQKYAAIGIAFIVSALCVLLTHQAGHELYRSLKIKRARKDWIEEGRKHKLRTKSMPLTTAQHLDDAEPEYTQICNRVGLDASFVVSWATLAFVLIIAIGATYVRVQSANKLMEDSVRIQKSELVEQRQTGVGLDLAQQNVIPDADANLSLAADGKAVEEAAQYDLHGYWVTFAILAVLFVFLQGLGVLFGYRWGFAGENSKAAYKALGKGKFLTYADVRAASQQYIDKAQNQLENLQQRMIQHHADKGTGVAVHPNKSFLEFLDSTDREETDYRTKKRAALHEEQRRLDEERERAQAHKASKSALNAGTGLAAAELETPVARAGDVGRAISELDRLGDDTQAKRAYLDTLPEHVFAEVKLVLQERKENAAAQAKKQRAAEIEDLL